MIRLLILAYDFPPYVSVGGLRPHSWFKYLHLYDVYPIIVTRQWGNRYGNQLDYITSGESSQTLIETSEKGIIVRTPYATNLANRLMLKYGDSKFRLLRKSISAFYEFGQFLLPIGPKSNLYHGAEEYLRNNKVDVIIATGEPFVLFKYAAELSKKHDIPWIADYRDPWSQDKNRKAKGVPTAWDTYLEKKFLSNVSAITTVSEFFSWQIAGLIPDKAIHVVANGYDPEAVDKVSTVNQSSEKLSIAIVGTIYKWHPVESFLRVCSNFVRRMGNSSEFEINFYGVNAGDHIKGLVEAQYENLKPVIKIHPKIPNEEFIAELVGNSIFVLFNHYTTVGTKIYDFVALKRQILLCYDEDKEAQSLKEKFYNMAEPDSKNDQLQKQILQETNSGIVVKNAEHLEVVLDNLYSEFKTKGFVSCSPTNTEQFSRKAQALKLTKVIEEVLSSRRV